MGHSFEIPLTPPPAGELALVLRVQSEFHRRALSEGWPAGLHAVTDLHALLGTHLLVDSLTEVHVLLDVHDFDDHAGLLGVTGRDGG